MKIAFVGFYPMPGAPARGGVEVATVDLAEALAARGHEVLAVSPTTTPGRQSDGARNGVLVKRARTDRRLGATTGWFLWCRGVNRLLESWGPEVVHGQSLMIGGLPAARWKKTPTLVTAHGDPRRDASHGADPTNRSIRWKIIDRRVRSVAATVGCVVSPSPDWALHFHEKPRHFVHIPHMPPAELPDILEWRTREPIVVFAGGSQRGIKGFDRLAAAWPRVLQGRPDARLDLVGWDAPPPDLPGVMLPVDGSTLDRRTASERIARATVLVMPSVFEVAPLAVIDAWSVGTPVVATSVGGMPRMVNGAGFLVPPGDPLELSIAILSALSRCNDANTFALEGMARMRSVDREKITDAYEDLYSRLVRLAK